MKSGTTKPSPCSKPGVRSRDGHLENIEIWGAFVRAPRAGRGDEKGLLSLFDTDLAIDGPVTLISADQAGLPGRELVRRGLAFRDGGAEGLAVLEEAWDPDPQSLPAGRALLGAGATARRNRVTLGRRQLRLGSDGRWYPLRKDGAGLWIPDGAPITLMPDDDEVGDLDDGLDA
jgi:hypothetical protein